MTDTTDIKALREASEIGESSDYMTWPKVDPAKLKRVLDHLEAERHKGDLWFGKVADLEAALKAERQRAGTRIADLEKRLRYTEETLIAANDLLTAAAEARVKELKGDQVPVAWVVRPSAASDISYVETDQRCIEVMVNAGVELKPLFTAPQNPVVLPARVTAQDMRETFNYLMSQEEADAAANGFNQCLIEAAGGLVKVTDKCHPSLMESVTVPHNVIGSYEDASGGRSDIVTLSDKREMKDMSSIVKDGE